MVADYFIIVSITMFKFDMIW